MVRADARAWRLRFVCSGTRVARGPCASRCLCAVSVAGARPVQARRTTGGRMRAWQFVWGQTGRSGDKRTSSPHPLAAAHRDRRFLERSPYAIHLHVDDLNAGEPGSGAAQLPVRSRGISPKTRGRGASLVPASSPGVGRIENASRTTWAAPPARAAGSWSVAARAWPSTTRQSSGRALSCASRSRIRTPSESQSGRKLALISSRAGSLSSAASSFPRLEKPSLRAYSRNSLIARRTSH